MVQDSLVGNNSGFTWFQNLEIKLIVDSLASWNKLSMHCPLEIKESNNISSFLVLTFALSCDWVSLEISIACSVTLFQVSSEKPNFHSQ
jgi:hypothetical protein